MNRNGRKEKTSLILKVILEELPAGTVSLGYLLKKLRRRSFGGILIMLAAISLIPGISVFSGLLMIVIGIQLAAGFDAPVFPKFLAERQFETKLIVAIGARVIPAIERIEEYVRPRWLFLSRSPVANLFGLLVICLSAVVMLPLPFSNMPPAIALIAMSVALLERDGLIMLFGMVLAAIALVIGVVIASVAFKATFLLLAGA
jgi:hypothetical protein